MALSVKCSRASVGRTTAFHPFASSPSAVKPLVNASRSEGDSVDGGTKVSASRRTTSVVPVPTTAASVGSEASEPARRAVALCANTGGGTGSIWSEVSALLSKMLPDMLPVPLSGLISICCAATMVWRPTTDARGTVQRSVSGASMS